MAALLQRDRWIDVATRSLFAGKRTRSDVDDTASDDDTGVMTLCQPKAGVAGALFPNTATAHVQDTLRCIVSENANSIRLKFTKDVDAVSLSAAQQQDSPLSPLSTASSPLSQLRNALPFTSTPATLPPSMPMETDELPPLTPHPTTATAFVEPLSKFPAKVTAAAVPEAQAKPVLQAADPRAVKQIGKYKLERKVGRGTYGEVRQAINLETNERVRSMRCDHL
jgi:hypothetical protein